MPIPHVCASVQRTHLVTATPHEAADGWISLLVCKRHSAADISSLPRDSARAAAYGSIRRGGDLRPSSAGLLNPRRAFRLWQPPG